ncbi:hypothetical protein [Bradyrhizobium sp. ORS 285]|uniref:hypothetical protein n=1 Tax=Bradyrhizobium sp. ORS 285 TaxID=115808 RepID=UPI0005537A07|nr:hypothetical protein [Bradyrhizobium sp. ORS 285]
MRFSVLGFAVLLAGCGTNADIGNPFIEKVSAFSTALSAQDSLEIDLMKDFARKSEQLRFISYDTYSCGDPDDKVVQDLENYYRNASIRFRKTDYSVLLEARTDIRSKDAILAALASYGDLISDISKQYKAIDTTIAKADKVIDTFKSSELIPEASLVLGGLKSVITIAQTIERYTAETAIRTAAVSMSAPLSQTLKALSKKKTLLSLTGPEALAFSYWDSCALERLRFIRDYYPSILTRTEAKQKEILKMHLGGTTRTSVIDFAREYSAYLSEREGFVGRRPDYLKLLKQIADANAELINLSGNDLLDVANNIGTMTTSIAKASNDLRKAGY